MKPRRIARGVGSTFATACAMTTTRGATMRQCGRTEDTAAAMALPRRIARAVGLMVLCATGSARPRRIARAVGLMVLCATGSALRLNIRERKPGETKLAPAAMTFPRRIARAVGRATD